MQITAPRCTILSDSFDLVVQCALFLVALLVLVGKRLREVPRRPLRVWAMDSSKQCAGAGLAHLSNMAVATLLAAKSRGGGSDECAFYAVNFFFDVTAGVLLLWMQLRALERCAARRASVRAVHVTSGAEDAACAGTTSATRAAMERTAASAAAAVAEQRPWSCWAALRKSGEYSLYRGGPPSWRVFWAQMFAWLGLVATSKILLAVPMYLLRRQVGELGDMLFAPLREQPKVELVVVMIVGPCVLNALQFYVTDNFIRSAPQQRQRLRVQRRRPSPLGGRAVAATIGIGLSYLKGGGGAGRHAHTRLDDDDEGSGSSRPESPLEPISPRAHDAAELVEVQHGTTVRL